MNGALPEGWVELPFGELLTELRNGISSRPNLEPPGAPILRISAVRPGSVSLDDYRFLPDADDAATTFALRDRDLLFTRYNGSLDLLGVCGMVRGHGKEVLLYPDKLMRVRVDERITSPEYLELYFQSPSARDAIMAVARSSAGQQGISGANLKGQLVALPPLPEQRRIVDQVEALLALVNAANDRLARVPDMLRRFRQSIQDAASSGRLTEDWRDRHPQMASPEVTLNELRRQHETHSTGRRGNAAAPSEEAHDLDGSELPPNWQIAELQWLCEPGRPITYGILKPGPDWPDGVPYVRVADFPRHTVNLGAIRRTSPEIANGYRRSTLRSGDLLLSIRGTFGRVCRVPPELSGANITQDTARLTIVAGVHADYIALYLRSPSAQDRMKRAAKGVAVRGINIGDVRALQIALPPIQEQVEIVRRVDAFFKFADTIERRIAAATVRANRLTQAILAKAFSGELVPTEAELARAEGRTYEPATTLLKRIRTAAGAQPMSKIEAPRVQLRSASIGKVTRLRKDPDGSMAGSRRSLR